MSDTFTIHLIDDDDAVRDSLCLLFEVSGFSFVAYESALAFLDKVEGLASVGCILSDIRMPKMDGLELQRILIEKKINLPIIIMTGHADVPIAVQALKAGAADFIEKPFTNEALLAAIAIARDLNKKAVTTVSLHADVLAKLESLTPREREVLDGLLVGHPNKTIAFDLGMSPRTVEVHRARVMQKMNARSLSELVRTVISLGQRSP